MSDIDKLVEHFRGAAEFEIDHGVDIYIEPEKAMSWRDVKKIRECGYQIQDIENGEQQTRVTCVENQNIPPGLLHIANLELNDETLEKIKHQVKS